MMVSFATALVAVSAVLCLGGVPATGIRGDHRSSGGTLKVRSRRSHTSSAAAAVPANACVICGTQSTKSKPTINSLTFKWTGANDALATLDVDRSKLSTLYEVHQSSGASYTTVRMAATGSKFSANTAVTISGETLYYHTSCSVPLYIGQALKFAGGDLILVGFVTAAFDDTVCGPNGRTDLTTTAAPATAATTSAPHWGKGKGKAHKLQASIPAGACMICGEHSSRGGAYGYHGKGAKGSKKGGKKGKSSKSRVTRLELDWSGNDLTALGVTGSGAEVSVQSDHISITHTARTSKLPTNLVLIIGGGANIVSLHTSCSVPLYVGQTFDVRGLGELEITGFATTLFDDSVCNGGGGATPAPPACVQDLGACPPCNVCDKSQGKRKIQTLVMEYIGADGGTAVSNTQDGDATVDGSAVSGPAIITTSTGAALQIDEGEQFSVAPEGAFTYFDVIDDGDDREQRISIHSSCSKPLNINDQFGALRLKGVVLKTGQTQDDVCPACTLCNTTTTPPRRATTAPYTPGGCNGIPESPLCGNVYDKSACATLVNGTALVASKCPVLCEVCTTTSTTTTSTTTTSTTTTSTTTTSTTSTFTVPDCKTPDCCSCPPEKKGQCFCCTPESGDAADKPAVNGTLVFKGPTMEACREHVDYLNTYFGFAANNAAGLMCIKYKHESTGRMTFTIAGASTVHLELRRTAAIITQKTNGEISQIQHDLQDKNGQSISAKVTDLSTELGIEPAFAGAGYNQSIQATTLFGCRRIAMHLNRNDNKTTLCTETAQARFYNRSCYDPKGLDEKDCGRPFRWGGNGPRPSAGKFPGDQVFIPRNNLDGELEANRPDLQEETTNDQVKKLRELRKQQGSSEPVRLTDSWFFWNYLKDSTGADNVPDVGYDECEGDPDCQVFKDVTGQDGLAYWDEVCFEQPSNRCLPDADGNVPDSQAKADSCTVPTSSDQGGQAYNRVCDYAAEDLVIKCEAPHENVAAAVGALSYCGCSYESNQFIKQGYANLCQHSNSADENGRFDGKICDPRDASNLRLPDNTTADDAAGAGGAGGTARERRELSVGRPSRSGGLRLE